MQQDDLAVAGRCVVGSEQGRGRARSWWWSAAAVVAALGWGAALLTTPASALVASAVVFAAVSLLFTTGVQAHQEERDGVQGGATADWRQILDHTLVGTVGAIAALGLLRVSVAMTLLAALGLGVGAMWAFSRHPSSSRHRSAAGPVAPAGGLRIAASTSAVATMSEEVPGADGSTPAVEVGAMTTTELVLAWRRSYLQLMGVRSPSQLAILAARRQQLLDELERRDRPGVERWLRSGARAASDPSRFLQRPRGPSATSA